MTYTAGTKVKITASREELSGFDIPMNEISIIDFNKEYTIREVGEYIDRNVETGNSYKLEGLNYYYKHSFLKLVTNMYNPIKITGTNLNELIPHLAGLGYSFEGCSYPPESDGSCALNVIYLNEDESKQGIAHFTCESLSNESLSIIHFAYPENKDLILEKAKLTETMKNLKKSCKLYGQVFEDGDKIIFKYMDTIISDARIRVWDGNRVYLLTNLISGDIVPDSNKVGYTYSYVVSYRNGKLLDSSITDFKLLKPKTPKPTSEKVKIDLGIKKGEWVSANSVKFLWNNKVVHKDEPTSKFTRGNYQGSLYATNHETPILLKDNYLCSPKDEIITIHSTGEKILLWDAATYRVDQDYNNGKKYEYTTNMVRGYIDSRANKGWFTKNNSTLLVQGLHWYISERVARELGLEYSPEDGDWISSQELNRVLWGYHSGHRTEKGIKSNTKFTVGFEIEKEDLELREKEPARKLFKRTGWAKERDGSLSEVKGFELVSPVFDLFDNDTILASFEDVKEYINAKYSKKTCGGHINLAIVGVDKRIMFDKVSGYLPLLYSMYENRMGERYCQAKKKRDMIYGDKYQAIAIKDNRIEIRIFSVVRNVKQLVWRLKFMQIMANNLTNSTIKVLKMAIDPKTDLHKHLLEVYNLPMLKNRVYKALEHYQNIENIPISSKTKDRFKTLTKDKFEGSGVELDSVFDELNQVSDNSASSIITTDSATGINWAYIQAEITNIQPTEPDVDFEELWDDEESSPGF